MKKLFYAIFISVTMLLPLSAVDAQPWLTADVEARAQQLLSQMTEAEKLDYVGGVDGMYTRAIDRLGIPRVKMSDGPQGLGTHGPSTAYPCTVMLTATWNPALAYAYGHGLGLDAKARNVNVLLGPAVNIYRAAMCGRNFEYMGEDPWLASRTAVEYIKGVQDCGVMAVVKHFAANNQDYDRNYISSDIGERTLNEIYFPAFRAAVQEAGVGAVMTSYNLLNGVWTTENAWLLKDVLRRQWGFNGVVMSDWGATHNVLPAARGGLDLEMPRGEYMSPDNLRKLLRAGEITQAEIDTKVLHILRTFLAFGFFGQPTVAEKLPLDNPVCREIALKVAREGVVLLKNEDNILPISRKKVRKIAVVGDNACRFVCGGGSGHVTPFSHTTFLDGVKAYGEKHKIQVEYINVRDFMPQVLFAAAGSQERGFRGEYFATADLSGAPAVVRTDADLNFDWSAGTGIEALPRESYSVRWSGVIRPAVSGEYRLVVGGDDGYRAYFDGVKVADEWSAHAFHSQSFTRMLEAGHEYKVVLEYYQAGGGAAFDFSLKMLNAPSDRFVAALDKADLVLANIGFNASNEAEGGDRTFDLPLSESELMEAVLRSKTPVVGVVNAGGGVNVTALAPRLKGLLWAWYPGEEGGRALGEILFGEVSPSGKLPMTIEKKWADNPVYDTYYQTKDSKRVTYDEGIFVGYRGYDKLNREVQYPFGYGLTYSTFELSEVKVEAATEGRVEVTYTLKNTGKVPAAQVVQIYVGKQGETAVDRPVKELKGYEKIALKPGESRKVTTLLDHKAFAYFSVRDGRFVSDNGQYLIQLGFSSRDIQHTAVVTMK
ncbi:MAG: glycoside hydrolase family 3 C-terminal domain-containing protein [Alistipes sp.]